ncbi:MAG TPA: M20 family metallopeptidase [Tepidisphaeraceae bacterium]|jgi:amidohydrolase|nr:M20 family metallopeptidase [Tepidisphaeraceae bacterium]
MNLDSAIENHFALAADLRHRLHRIPELAFQEFRTAAMIRAELDRLGIAHIDGVADALTATICVIGDPAKPCIALRADIDALPIQEMTSLPYASTHPNRMHACGHDGHTATLMGAGGILKQLQGELPVCVKLIFQPAEEDGGGAGRLVRAGVLDGRIGPPVRAIFGLHGWPGLPLGCVAGKSGPLLAATDVFKATMLGKGCHGGYPHLGADPVVSACEAVVNLQQIVSRDLDPTEPAVVTIGMIHGGTATNIIPDQVTIEGTARTLSESSRALVKSAISRRVAGIAAASGCAAKIEWIEGYPATINDPAMADYVAKTARETLGSDRYIPIGRPSMGGEDFSYYLQKTPGCFFLVGVEPQGQKNYPSLHTDGYDFTDAALAVGMRMYLGIVRNFPAAAPAKDG